MFVCLFIGFCVRYTAKKKLNIEECTFIILDRDFLSPASAEHIHRAWNCAKSKYCVDVDVEELTHDHLFVSLSEFLEDTQVSDLSWSREVLGALTFAIYSPFFFVILPETLRETFSERGKR